MLKYCIPIVSNNNNLVNKDTEMILHKFICKHLVTISEHQVWPEVLLQVFDQQTCRMNPCVDSDHPDFSVTTQSGAPPVAAEQMLGLHHNQGSLSLYEHRNSIKYFLTMSHPGQKWLTA